MRLLVDGDLLAYSMASAVEVAIEWEPGYWTWHCDEDAVKSIIEDRIEEARDLTKADKVTLCLSDDDHNFRKDILPTYKGNRAKLKRPIVLKSIKEWMKETKGAVSVPSLEADDVMGILHTRNKKHNTVVLSLDKDMKSIPGLYMRSITDPIVEITEDEADRYHLFQTLKGDVIDGYSGCPGIGETKAHRAAFENIGVMETTHVLKRGPRKGEEETRWEDHEYDTPVQAVLSLYKSAGLTYDDFLVQARVARILRASDYDLNKMELILWNPS